MRKLIIAFVLCAASAALAQPAVGISKRSPIIGSGTVGDPLRLNPCPVGQTPVSTDATGLGTYACSAVGGGGVSDGDKGDVTVSGGGATWTIDNSVVTLAKMANVATNVILGRTTAGTGAPEALTPTQVTAMLNVATTGLKGLMPVLSGSATQYLDGTGSWSTPAGGGTITTVATTSPMAIGTTQGGSCASGSCTVALRAANTSRFFGRITAGAGNAEEMTGTQATTLLDPFSSTLKGLVPLSGGGTTNYLRADGSWAAPSGTTYTNGTGLALSTNTFSVNIAGASCSAGSHMSSLSATGTGGCTADTGLTGTGTANYLARYTGAGTTLAISAVSDDSSQITLGRNTSLLGYFGATDEIAAFNGNTILLNGHILFGNSTNATYRGYINKVGYAESTTQFRDLEVDDGKGGKVFDVVGSSKTTSFSGPVNLSTSLIGGDASFASGVRIAVKSNAPTLTGTGCGTGASVVGDATGGHLTTGTSPSGTCAISLSFVSAAPSCVVSTRSTTKGFGVTNINATAITLNTLTASTVYDWICVDHY